ncbi:globin [bacterium]|nr:globin [bacterium]
MQNYQIVNRQYGSCSLKPEFFDDFYADFTSQSPEIRAFFAKTDMPAQKQALRSGLAFLIMYAAGKQLAVSKLEHLGKTHSRGGYNIRPELYPLWIGALIRTVKKHTPDFDATSEKAWKSVLQKGVDLITSWY